MIVFKTVDVKCGERIDNNKIFLFCMSMSCMVHFLNILNF